MNQTITLTLIKPQILESVKNETFHRGNFDKAVDPKAVTAAYIEQAGNDSYQERILQRGLYTSIAELETHLSDYLSTSGYTSATNYIGSSESGDNIVITLVVGNRFNRGYTDALAKLCSKYIEDLMLVDWWKIVNEKQSSLYALFVERDLAAIKRCFTKTAPSQPTVPYPTTLSVVDSAICIGIGEEYTVTYSISDGSIDDIEVKIEDTVLIEAGRTEDGFTVKGKQKGHTYIQLYSRHDPELTETIHVYIVDQS